MDPEMADAEGFDPDSPLARFITGLAQVFYGEAGAGALPQRPPEELKAAVEQVILEVVPEPPRVSVKPPRQLADEAVAAAWEALEAGRPEAEDLALMALRYWPNCGDAYTLLGVSAGPQIEIALPLFTLAVMAGAEALGPEGFERNAGRFWETPETRGFMVAMGFLARANREAGALDAAAAHLVEMLNLNPSDEQGARYDLLAIALQTGRLETAAKILEAYPDDQSAPFAWARALFTFMAGGDTDDARLALREAKARNAHVADFLIGTRPIPDEVPDTDDPGSEVEAVLYLDLMGEAWSAKPGAREWVRRHTVTTPTAPPVKEKRSGPREV